jgi:hypothetical protein
VFVHGKTLQPTLIFLGKARACLSGVHTLGQAPGLTSKQKDSLEKACMERPNLFGLTMKISYSACPWKDFPAYSNICE